MPRFRRREIRLGDSGPQRWPRRGPVDPAVPASPPPLETQASLSRSDTLDNPAVRRTEWHEASAAPFALIDPNHDGPVPPGERGGNALAREKLPRVDRGIPERLSRPAFGAVWEVVWRAADLAPRGRLTSVESGNPGILWRKGRRARGRAGRSSPPASTAALTKDFPLLGLAGDEILAVMDPGRSGRTTPGAPISGGPLLLRAGTGQRNTARRRAPASR